MKPTSENYEGLKVRIQQPIQDHRFNSMVYFEKIIGKKNYGKKMKKLINKQLLKIRTVKYDLLNANLIILIF